MPSPDPLQLQALSLVRTWLHDPAVARRYAFSPADFTRTRRLSFALVATFILTAHRYALNAKIKWLDRLTDTLSGLFSASALCQARAKLRAELFRDLGRELARSHEQAARQAGHWRTQAGARVLAADCTWLHLPDTPETRLRFGVHPNGGTAEAVMAQTSTVVDALNGLVLSAAPCHSAGEAALLMSAHPPDLLRPGDILLLDRGYCSYPLLAWLAGKRVHPVLRLQRSSFAAAERFRRSGRAQGSLTLRRPPQAGKHLPKILEVRLVRVWLGGEEAVLLTTLPGGTPRTLAALYRLRWDQESFFGRWKNTLECERVSGRRMCAVEQDFHALVLLANLESILARSVQKAFDAAEAGGAPPCRVNRKDSLSSVAWHTARLLADPSVPLESACARITRELRHGPVLIRPDRSHPRKPPTASGQVRFLKYARRVTP